MRAQGTPVRKDSDQQGARPVPVPGPPAQRVLDLQRLAGNAAVTQAIAEERHEHDAGCGHTPSVQRRALVHDVVRSPGQSMDPVLRGEMEARFGGADFSGVRVHTGATARASAVQLQAKAYTSGPNVVVGDTMTKEDWAHELTHYQDQLAGPVPGTDNGTGVRVSDVNDSGERRAVDNARKVMSGSVPQVQRMPATAQASTAPAPTGAVQRVTKLAVQQGPSCWLYVLEAIAEHHGLPIQALSVAMRAYPTTADRDDRQREEKQRGNSIEGRRLAVMMTAEALAVMVNKLDNWRAHQDPSVTDITRDEVALFARRSMGAETSLDKLDFQNGSAQFASIRDVYAKAQDRATKLVQKVGAQGDEVNKLLDTAPAQIDASQSLNDVHLAMTHQSLPCYAGIKRRFKLKAGDDTSAPELDLTSRLASTMESTVHAVLIDSYDTGSREVRYKDPNYGNITLKVSLSQFQRMAGNSSQHMTLRPYSTGPRAKPGLDELKD
ncbi:eCIS core domain-containing protein [Streptomyces sp. NPDC002499]